MQRNLRELLHSEDRRQRRRGNAALTENILGKLLVPSVGFVVLHSNSRFSSREGGDILSKLPLL
ncbi:hypothetical protein DPV73_10420 [Leptospira mayottensis]|nr:hypothetical protein DPV73_10420 [Leptospira mayottensis]